MEKYCTLVISHDKAAMPSQQEIMAELEKADVGAKTRAIKKVLLMLLNGERMPKLVMTVIRCVLATMATLVAWDRSYRRGLPARARRDGARSVCVGVSYGWQLVQFSSPRSPAHPPPPAPTCIRVRQYPVHTALPGLSNAPPPFPLPPHPASRRTDPPFSIEPRAPRPILRFSAIA